VEVDTIADRERTREGREQLRLRIGQQIRALARLRWSTLKCRAFGDLCWRGRGWKDRPLLVRAAHMRRTEKGPAERRHAAEKRDSYLQKTRVGDSNA
jgi:hypothetical protein